MKHIDYFDNFLKNTVNLSEFNLDILESRVESIYKALKADSGAGPRIQKKVPQGSWAQRTIINPHNGAPFDGDFMVRMTEDPEWAEDLNQYGNTIYRALHKHPTYGAMDHGRKCRCVYVNYANNAMHIDIVPFVTRSDGTHWIVNRDDSKWERTDPERLTAWMKERDTIAQGNLRKVIRLMKFLRNHKNSFTGTKSVLLTTLLGERVDAWRKIIDTGYYFDLPTALLHIVADLDDYLQQHETKPVVMDPAETGTSFDHRWSQETYAYFRQRIHTHAKEIDDAYHEQDHDKSVAKWQALFGDGFMAPEPATPGKYDTVGAGGTAAGSSVTHSGRAG